MDSETKPFKYERSDFEGPKKRTLGLPARKVA
jgi:hypothetical protein